MDMRALRLGLAQSYFDERDYRAAIDELVAIAEQTPGDVSVRLLLARAYYHAALLPRAEEQLREIIELDPTEPYARLMLARTLERQSRHPEASTHRRVLAALTGDDTVLNGYRYDVSRTERAA